jgi:hypothetical protein
LSSGDCLAASIAVQPRWASTWASADRSPHRDAAYPRTMPGPPIRRPLPRRPWRDFLELIGRGLFVAVPAVAGSVAGGVSGAIAGAVSGAVLGAAVEVAWPGPLTRRQTEESAALAAIVAWTNSQQGDRERRARDRTFRAFGGRDVQ